MDDIANEGDKQGVARCERASMIGDLWFGHLIESDGRKTIMVFDHDMPELPDDEVYLYNAREKCIAVYKKDMIRPRLVPAKNIPTAGMNSIKSEFRSAKRKLEESTIEWEIENGPQFDDDREPFIFSDKITAQTDIDEERRMYTELLSRSEQDGWCYPDVDGAIIDNLPGPY